MASNILRGHLGSFDGTELQERLQSTWAYVDGHAYHRGKDRETMRNRALSTDTARRECINGEHGSCGISAGAVETERRP